MVMESPAKNRGKGAPKGLSISPSCFRRQIFSAVGLETMHHIVHPRFGACPPRRASVGAQASVDKPKMPLIPAYPVS